MFEEAIIKNNSDQIAKLWGPAEKAHANPDTGIEVLKKGAYFVIRDCAKVARMCLPIYVWELYDDPVTSLKGKFTKVDVEDFLKRSESNPEAIALKKVILNDIKVKHQLTDPAPSQPQSISFEESGDDLYGYYEGYDDAEEEKAPVVVSAESLSDDDLFRKYLL